MTIINSHKRTSNSAHSYIGETLHDVIIQINKNIKNIKNNLTNIKILLLDL